MDTTLVCETAARPSHTARATTRGALAGDIRGRVVKAASDTPLAGAIVDVTAAGAQLTLGRATSVADGSFRLAGLKAGRYHVHIRPLGDRPWDNPSVAVASGTVDLGILPLVSAPLELESVAVTGKRI